MRYFKLKLLAAFVGAFAATYVLVLTDVFVPFAS